jgi:hypothetical protein
MSTQRRDLAVIEEDSRGNARRLIVIPDEQENEIIHVEAPQLPVRPNTNSRANAIVEGSYQDRARAFSHVTLNLSLVTGAGLVVAAMVLGDTTSFALLTGYFFTGFCLVWLLSFILHTFVSAEGVEVIETLLYWQFIKREQSERFRRSRPEPVLWPAMLFRAVIAVASLVGLYAVFGR